MQIFAKTMDGKTVAFEVQKTERVSDIKKKIQEKIGLAPDEQKLVYQGGILEDEKSVEDYQIAEKSKMQIFVKSLDGKSIAFEVLKTDKIWNVKLKIQEKLAIVPIEQKLTFQGIVLDDEKSIGDLNITDKSVISLFTRIKGGF